MIISLSNEQRTQMLAQGSNHPKIKWSQRWVRYSVKHPEILLGHWKNDDETEDKEQTFVKVKPAEDEEVCYRHDFRTDFLLLITFLAAKPGQSFLLVGENVNVHYVVGDTLVLDVDATIEFPPGGGLVYVRIQEDDD